MSVVEFSRNLVITNVQRTTQKKPKRGYGSNMRNKTSLGTHTITEEKKGIEKFNMQKAK